MCFRACFVMDGVDWWVWCYGAGGCGAMEMVGVVGVVLGRWWILYGGGE